VSRAPQVPPPTPDDSGPLSALARTRAASSDREAQFRAHRIARLIEVNLDTFWSIAVILLGFSLWDAFVDPLHYRSAFVVRASAAAIVVATGFFQKLPGKSRWMPFMAKVRLVIAVAASVIAAGMLDRGYGYGVAGLVVIILTGPYVAIDSRDLRMTNFLILAALVPVMFAVDVDRFDVIGTVAFALLAVVVSTLLGRVLESSNRRAFALDLELHHDARTDALTGLANRRGMEERGSIELKRAKRARTPVSVILCDLDHFKKVNDRYGHEAGDTVLGRAATVLLGALRQTDALGRWGGEEFIAVLPATDARGAAGVAERMRAFIADALFDGLPGGVTISVGGATLPVVDDLTTAWEDLVKEADQNLYRAKSDGRNRVVTKSESD
jgi:diguanylate cyclase (GGDEF)-like protein